VVAIFLGIVNGGFMLAGEWWPCRWNSHTFSAPNAVTQFTTPAILLPKKLCVACWTTERWV